MFTSLEPANWLDWLIVLYTACGVLSGLRRGLILSLAAVAATVAAVALAVHFSPSAVAFALARWHLQTHIADFLGRVMPLPDGAGATPYSPSAAALLGQQIGNAASSSYARAVDGILTALPPLTGSLPATLGGYVDRAVANRVVTLLAFVTIVLLSEAILLVAARLLLGRVARRGLAGAMNAVTGGAVGGVERLAQATLFLAILASLSLIPQLSGLAGPLHRSHWAPFLLTIVKKIVPTRRI